MSEWLLKLLNLDGIVGKKKDDVREEASTGSAWIAAGDEVERTHDTAALPWQTEGSGRAWYWRVLRTLLIAAAVIVLLVGLRTMFFPVKPAPVSISASAEKVFPEATAIGVAERFTEAYLTWNEDAPAERSAVLRLDVPKLGDDNRFGWDGKGQQTATDAHVIRIDSDSEVTATATVVVRLGTATGDTVTERWTALAVPLAVSDDRVIVTGQPATVAVPPATPVSGDSTRERANDPAIERDTAEYAQTFFTAYGRDADVSSLTAPGSGIAGLGGFYTLENIKDWTVYDGKGDTRIARAVVVWQDAGLSQLEQTYQLTLTQVSGGDTTRWQITDLTGSTN